MRERVRVLLVASSLGRGGLERQAVAMAAGLDPARFDTRLAVLHGGGGLEAEARERLGARLVTLCPSRVWRARDLPLAFARLLRLVWARRPDVVYGMQPVVNELALAAARLCGARAMQGIRFSNVDWAAYSRAQALAHRAGAALSRRADALVANSHAGLEAARTAGYRAPRMLVVHNGIDVRRFRPDPLARAEMRRILGVPLGAPLVGQIGRLDRMKDFPMFLRAAASFARRRQDAAFVVAGGPRESLPELERLAGALGLGGRVRFLGPLAAMERLYPALDVLALSSAFGEGFPNVVGEAMACGVPCAATAVGDAPLVVGDTGLVVPAGDHEAMAVAWQRLCEDAPVCGEAARTRIENRFSEREMLETMEYLLTEVVEGH